MSGRRVEFIEAWYKPVKPAVSKDADRPIQPAEALSVRASIRAFHTLLSMTKVGGAHADTLRKPLNLLPVNG